MAIVKTAKSLNRSVINVISAADFDGRTPVVGFAVDDVSAVPIKLTGIAASALFFDSTDKARVLSAQIFIQEGLRMSDSLAWSSPDEKNDKKLFDYFFNDPVELFEPISLSLPPGQSYGIGFAIYFTAAPVSFVRMQFNVQGEFGQIKGSPRLKG